MSRKGRKRRSHTKPRCCTPNRAGSTAGDGKKEWHSLVRRCRKSGYRWGSNRGRRSPPPMRGVCRAREYSGAQPPDHRRHRSGRKTAHQEQHTATWRKKLWSKNKRKEEYVSLEHTKEARDWRGRCRWRARERRGVKWNG